MKKLDSQQQASAAQFERQSGRYGRSHILAETSDVLRALDHVIFNLGDPALDVATGGGHAALCLARAGLEVTLGDVSPKMLSAATALLQEEGFTPAEVREFPAEAMPFADATFALVSSRVAPHHFSSPADFVRETARVLRPGGSMLLIDGSVPDDDPETDEWLNQVERWRDPSHGRCLARAEWERLAVDAGLGVVTSRLEPMVQPDLDRYFDIAGTSAGNRRRVLAAVEDASDHVRAAMNLRVVRGRIAWTWQRLSLVARKVG